MSRIPSAKIDATTARLAPFAIAALALAACGGNGGGGGEDECAPGGDGELCPCVLFIDCPQPQLQECVGNVCVAVSDEDVDNGDGGDTDTDAGPDTDEDTDTTDDVETVDDADAAEVTPDTGPVLDDNYNPWIVYASGNPLAEELVFVQSNGSGRTTLDNCATVACDTVNDDLFRAAPEFSADGTRVAFLSIANDGVSADYRVGVVDLTDATFDYYNIFSASDGTAGRASTLSWSPDGTQIVFSGRPQPRSSEDRLSILTLATGDVTPLTEIGDGGQADTNPVWSPGGEFIYFSRFDGSSSDLLTVDIESGATTPLVTNEAIGGIVVSNDETRLYYVVVNTDAPSSLRGYDFALEEDYPVSSIGDEGLSFFRAATRYAASRDVGVGGNARIEVMVASSSDSAQIGRLTDNAVPDRSPSVSLFDACELTSTVLPSAPCAD
jgi:hypothetical protein